MQSGVILRLLKAALPVGAVSGTLTASGLEPGSEFIDLIKLLYKTRITVLLPTPAPPPI